MGDHIIVKYFLSKVNEIDIIYQDFTKAFDMMIHGNLLVWLGKMGISTKKDV